MTTEYVTIRRSALDAVVKFGRNEAALARQKAAERDDDYLRGNDRGAALGFECMASFVETLVCDMNENLDAHPVAEVVA